MKPVIYHTPYRNRHRARPYLVLALLSFIFLVLLSLVKPVTDPAFNNQETFISEEN